MTLPQNCFCYTQDNTGEEDSQLQSKVQPVVRIKWHMLVSVTQNISNCVLKFRLSFNVNPRSREPGRLLLMKSKNSFHKFIISVQNLTGYQVTLVHEDELKVQRKTTDQVFFNFSALLSPWEAHITNKRARRKESTFAQMDVGSDNYRAASFHPDGSLRTSSLPK